MSTITIFKNSHAKIGWSFFDLDDDAIALIQCDDVYDEKALDLAGQEQLDEFILKSKKFEFFCEITRR